MKVEIVTSKYRLQISTSKTKTVDFKGRDPLRNKILINNDNSIIEQINIFSYVGFSVS